MIRSNLYAPTLDSRLVAKALASEADAITLDLEDSIVPQQKQHARELVVEYLSSDPGKPVYVRMNAVDSPWARDDVEAVAGTHASFLRIPKVESVETVLTVVGWLEELGQRMRIRCSVETALGVQRAFEIATAHPWVEVIGLGEADLRSDLGVESAESIAYSRSRVVIAARAAGLTPPPLSVFKNIKDLDGLRQDSVEGMQLGFFGRSALHPAQVPVINDVFRASADAIRRAQLVVDTSDAALLRGVGAIQLDDGSFIDEAVVKGARTLLARFAPGKSVR